MDEIVGGLALPSGASLAEAITEFVVENEDQPWLKGVGGIVEEIAAEVPR